MKDKKIITIEELENDNAEIVIPAYTKNATLILGMEMMLETILNNSNASIDDVFNEIKRIYERDNEKINKKAQKED